MLAGAAETAVLEDGLAGVAAVAERAQVPGIEAQKLVPAVGANVVNVASRDVAAIGRALGAIGILGEVPGAKAPPDGVVSSLGRAAAGLVNGASAILALRATAHEAPAAGARPSGSRRHPAQAFAASSMTGSGPGTISRAAETRSPSI